MLDMYRETESNCRTCTGRVKTGAVHVQGGVTGGIKKLDLDSFCFLLPPKILFEELSAGARSGNMENVNLQVMTF